MAVIATAGQALTGWTDGAGIRKRLPVKDKGRGAVANRPGYFG